ncbi:hypothetical protein TNCV_3219601 [Trichonephila clavipes]|nr:hypothetical protein TNCV_3219601 [Trichonephila clavipes]
MSQRDSFAISLDDGGIQSGNLGNDRADQLGKEETCQDMKLSMYVPLYHWKRLAWERTFSSCNSEYLSSSNHLSLAKM